MLVRAREALAFVPEETRRALPNGCSEYMRPLPGSARMYPETDVPAVVITEEMLRSVCNCLSSLAERAKRFEREYGLNAEQAKVMAASPSYPLFEEIVKNYPVSPSIVVRTLETIPIELARTAVPVSNLIDRHYVESLAIMAQGRVAKEGLTDLLRALAEHPEMTADEAAAAAGLAGVDEAEVEKAVRAIVASKADLVRSRGREGRGTTDGPGDEGIEG